jgi:hypothetical protein
LKLQCDEPLSDFAFTFKLRQYSQERGALAARRGERDPAEVAAERAAAAAHQARLMEDMVRRRTFTPPGSNK